jgi:hypothetical protein
MGRVLWVLVAGLSGVVGCTSSGDGPGSASSAVTETETTTLSRRFRDTVNALCDHRNAAIGTMRYNVLADAALLNVNGVTRTFSANVLGVIRDQIPYLRAAPGAPEGWDALVTEYEQRAQATDADSGEAATLAIAFFDPLHDLDRRAYDFGATRCPPRLLDGATRTPEQASYAVAASDVCMDLMTAYASVVLETTDGFRLGSQRLQPYRLNDDVVDELSATVAMEWSRAEPALRAIAIPAADSATVTALIDGIDAVMGVFPTGPLAARSEVLHGEQPFDVLDDEVVERYGLLPCTLRVLL